MRTNYPLKIAVIIPKYGLIGGAESFVYNLTERLAAQEDFDIHVLSSQWRKGEAPITFRKAPIIPFPRWVGPISFAYFAQKAIQSGLYDIIHSHDRIFNMDLLTFHGIPHKTWIKTTKRNRLSLYDRAVDWVERKTFNNPNLRMILPVSNLVKEQLLKLYNIPESKIRVIHPGVSIERFSALDKETCRFEIRQRYGLSQNDVVVLFVSMNFELKRLDLLLKGIAALVGSVNNTSGLKLLVVGKGNNKRYLTIARDLGISERVIFAGVTREVEKYYLASDIFALPSRFDTFGLVVLEAMAAGLPVIISRSMGARDVVDAGMNGFVLPDLPTPSDMATALGLLMDRETRMKIGENCRRVAFKYSWDRAANEVAQYYRMIGNGKK
ncbi:glycosyltransferase family 4 protein [Thermodesulfobacteriota bacterium]